MLLLSIMEKELDLPTAVAELLAYVADHPYDPREHGLPPREAKRIVEHDGCRYLVAFSRLKARGAPPGARSTYLLSVMKLDGIREGGGLPPSEEEGAAIARAFFPGGCMDCPEIMDALKLSRKYIALK